MTGSLVSPKLLPSLSFQINAKELSFPQSRFADYTHRSPGSRRLDPEAPSSARLLVFDGVYYLITFPSESLAAIRSQFLVPKTFHIFDSCLL